MCCKLYSTKNLAMKSKTKTEHVKFLPLFISLFDNFNDSLGHMSLSPPSPREHSMSASPLGYLYLARCVPVCTKWS